MILTLTLNPSLDRTIEVGSFAPGEVVRTTGTGVEPGGKGVNVTRALLLNGVRSRAVVTRGQDEGDQLVDALAAAGVDVIAIDVGGRTRSNVTVAEPSGRVTKFNEPGPALTVAELHAAAEAVLAAAGAADWVVLSGSLPPDVPDDHYANLTRRCLAAGVNVAVDTSGSALRHAASVGPTLVTPNRDELAEVTDLRIATIGDVVVASLVLQAYGAASVLTSLGGDGALLLEGDRVSYATCPAETVRSTVGAGDALLAGFLAAGGIGPEALRNAVAWGAASVALPGSQMPRPDDVRLDLATVTTEPDESLRLSP